MLIFESVFLIDIALKFLVSFTKDGETIPTKDLSKIAQRYLRKGFIFDFIPLIPFPLFLDLDHREAHFYIIKCIRIINGFKLFNIRVVMSDVRRVFTNRLDKIIANDPIAAEDIFLD